MKANITLTPKTNLPFQWLVITKWKSEKLKSNVKSFIQ